MTTLRLTRRGKIVVAVGVVLAALSVNALMWGKNVDCDLRETTQCAVVEVVE